jgi:hypothetical protein
VSNNQKGMFKVLWTYVRGVETKVVWKQTVLWRETVVESENVTLH